MGNCAKQKTNTGRRWHGTRSRFCITATERTHYPDDSIRAWLDCKVIRRTNPSSRFFDPQARACRGDDNGVSGIKTTILMPASDGGSMKTSGQAPKMPAFKFLVFQNVGAVNHPE
ncbi:uncharacterized protein LOC128233457 isoform X2 [Mya arenaria]|uniref:uncharacterized protein LOC128233457 isoform X2 n=1 Tax=Mya arenaria TaxID=6604 RepID=UPI0022E102B9|nr:uncharacterized protein LOC128233457 isoform X2 [Mya arenaria]